MYTPAYNLLAGDPISMQEESRLWDWYNDGLLNKPYMPRSEVLAELPAGRHSIAHNPSFVEWVYEDAPAFLLPDKIRETLWNWAEETPHAFNMRAGQVREALKEVQWKREYHELVPDLFATFMYWDGIKSAPKWRLRVVSGAWLLAASNSVSADGRVEKFYKSCLNPGECSEKSIQHFLAIPGWAAIVAISPAGELAGRAWIAPVHNKREPWVARRLLCRPYGVFADNPRLWEECVSMMMRTFPGEEYYLLKHYLRCMPEYFHSDGERLRTEWSPIRVNPPSHCNWHEFCLPYVDGGKPLDDRVFTLSSWPNIKWCAHFDSCVKIHKGGIR